MKTAWQPILAILLFIYAMGLPGIPPLVPIPGIDPLPKPPVVVVEPATNPFPSEGLSVLVVTNDDEQRDLPLSQISVLTSTVLRKRLRDLKADFRFWTVKETGSDDTPTFQAAAKVPRDSTPWIYIAHGRRGTSEPLPLTIDETIKLVEKFK